MRRMLTVLVATCAACSGTGRLAVETWGEDYIETAIPEAQGEEPGFVDGHTVRYDKFLVALSDLRVADHAGAVAAQQDEQQVFDLHRPGPTSVARFAQVPAGEWDQVSVVIRPADGASAGNAAPEDVERMNRQGLSVFVQGAIITSTRSFSFAWGFKTSTRYEACESAERQLGVIVPTGGSATMQLTLHGDHFFYDDLQADDAQLRARALVDADDGDGQITLEELRRVDLTRLPADQYGTGGDGAVEDLAGFVAALSRTVLHFQGEGECRIVGL